MPTGTLHNEAELLQLIAQGDEGAFKKLYDFYRNKLYSVAVRLTRSIPVAEEIVEDVFLKIWLRRNTLTDIQNFSAYLFTITRNEIYRVLKQIARNYQQIRLSGESTLLVSADIEDRIIVKEYSEILQQAIQRLPNQQKQVYTLMKEHGMKRDEVAVLLHLSPETVKYHLAQAVRNIRAFCLLHLDIHIRATFVLVFVSAIQ